MGCTRFLIAIGILSTLLLTAPAELYAQDPVTFDKVDSTPKGTIGLGLVGAELGLIIPSLAGLDKAWSLTVFPLAGAAGGAVAGYFLIDEPGHEKFAVAALAVGIAGILPAILLTVKATRYDPKDDTPKQSNEIPLANSGASPGDGLIQRSKDGMRLSVPGVHVGTMNTKLERVRFGLRAQRQIQLSLVSGVF